MSDKPTGDGPEVVWTIGDFDAGPQQFAGTWPTSTSSPEMLFRVGIDDPAKHFPAIHPGPLDGDSGFRPHTLIIAFERPRACPYGYLLTMRVQGWTGPAPQLEVDLNGHKGLILVRPTRVGFEHLYWPTPIGGWDTIMIALAPELFVEGINQLQLRTIVLDAPAPDELRAPHPLFGNVFGSILAHAGMELSENREPPEPARLTLVPTPLFVGEEHDLKELVDVIVEGACPGGVLSLAVGEQLERANLAPVLFGHARVRLAVSELAGPMAAHVSVGSSALSTTLSPCRKWTLHLMPHVHLDLGFTDYQGKVVEVHSRNLDRVNELRAHDPSYAYSIDGSYVVERYLESRAISAQDWLLDSLRDGSVSVNAFCFLFLTGLISLEELYRSAAFAATLRQDHDVTIDYANLTDVPSYSSALPSVLAAVGIRNFLGIANHFRAENRQTEQLHLASPFRWVGPDGAEVTTFLSRHYAQLRYLAGDPPTITGCAESFTRYTAMYERSDYLPQDLPIVGINSDNEDLALGEVDLVGRWSAMYAWPRLRYSTIRDYFATIEPLRDQLPRVSGDGGSYWEDGVGSHAKTVCSYRESQTLLPAAEALQALVATYSDALAPALRVFDEAWSKVLIGCEHTWTANHSVDQPHTHTHHDQLDWKTSQVHAGWRAAWDELRRGMSQLGELINTSDRSLIVFNGLSWSRSGQVEIEVETGLVLTDGGKPVPMVLLERRAGIDRLRLSVSDIPALGYRLLRFGTGELEAPSSTVIVDAQIDTGCYIVSIVDGRLVSLVHKATNRELLDQTSIYSLGEVLYVSGGGSAEGLGLGAEATSLYNVDWFHPKPDLTVVPAHCEHLELSRTEDGWLFVARTSAPSLPQIRTTIRFTDDDDAVNLELVLDKEAVVAKEAVYVAFPFAAAEPTYRYDRQQGWVDPSVDHQPGACNEWFTIQNAVVLETGEAGIAWTSMQAPLWTTDEPVAGRWPARFTARTGTILSWVMNNYWHTNFVGSQSGSHTFCYAFKPVARGELSAAARLGRELRLPLIAQDVNRLDKAVDRPGPLHTKSASLIEVEAPDCASITVMGARRSVSGVVVRVQDMTGEAPNVRICNPWPGGSAWQISAVEDIIGQITAIDDWVRVGVSAHGVSHVLFLPRA